MKHTASKISEFATQLQERRIKPLTIALLIAAFLLLGLPYSSLAQQAPTQPAPSKRVPQQPTPQRLRDMQRISVAEFGSSDIAKKIQERVIFGITQSGRLQVVPQSSRSQATLVGFVSSNRELTVNVRLIGGNGSKELWGRAVQAAVSSTGNQADAVASVAGRIVKQLLKAIEDDRAAQ